MPIKLCGVETDQVTFYEVDEEEMLSKKVQMSIYILSLNLKYACLQGVFGKEVGANDDEVLIAKSSTTTSTTPLQWRWVSTWCSTRWGRWSSRRRLWWTTRECLVPKPTPRNYLVCLLQASQTAKSFVSYDVQINYVSD